MKTNPLFLSSSVVEDNLHLFYQVFYYLRANGLDKNIDEMLLLLTAPKTAKQLATALAISKQALHKRLEKIKEKNWIETTSASPDGRQKTYSLNAYGRAALQQSITRAVKQLSGVYQQAGDEAVAGFVKVIELLYNQSQKTIP
ncbi:MAG: MarR family transcriptional regulator [Alphaproteobacteria bacterium]